MNTIFEYNSLRRFFISFYLIGFAGFIVPYTRGIFTLLIPFALIFSFIAVLVFQKQRFSKRHILVFISIYFFAFIIEAAGVNTGLIFGSYYYGNSLSIKVFNTPLLIGMNWLMLVYFTASAAERYFSNPFIKITTGALLMVFYDLLLEPSAPLLDMWYWDNGTIPLLNYLSWFIISLFMHSLLYVLKIRINNPVAIVVFVCQILFFAALLISGIIFPWG